MLVVCERKRMCSYLVPVGHTVFLEWRDINRHREPWKVRANSDNKIWSQVENKDSTEALCELRALKTGAIVFNSTDEWECTLLTDMRNGEFILISCLTNFICSWRQSKCSLREENNLPGHIKITRQDWDMLSSLKKGYKWYSKHRVHSSENIENTLPRRRRVGEYCVDAIWKTGQARIMLEYS